MKVCIHTISNGQPVFADTWDTGYTYGSYGNVYIYNEGVTYADGVIIIAAGYMLPEIEYDFGSPYPETFTFPAGVSISKKSTLPIS